MSRESEIGFLDEAAAEQANDAEFVADGLALDFAEQVARAMKSQGLTKAELGRRMGVSRAYTTRILDAPPNLTLLSMAKVALALGLTVRVHVSDVAAQEGASGAAGFGSAAPGRVRRTPKTGWTPRTEFARGGY